VLMRHEKLSLGVLDLEVDFWILLLGLSWFLGKDYICWVVWGGMDEGYFCSECKAGISKKEYDWSLKRDGVALCREHQGKARLEKAEENGLSDKQSRYSENMIKGRIAETLIEELFLSLKYNVFRYGMENTVPGIMKLLGKVRSNVANDIRRMPDFVVQDASNGQVYFVEVKFRKNGDFALKDLKEKKKGKYPFENAYFVVVSKKHIKCITYGELMDGKVVDAKSRNWLGNRKEFGLDKDVIRQFCEFAVKFFDGA
jgi:hypothetical protein